MNSEEKETSPAEPQTSSETPPESAPSVVDASSSTIKPEESLPEQQTPEPVAAATPPPVVAEKIVPVTTPPIEETPVDVPAAPASPPQHIEPVATVVTEENKTEQPTTEELSISTPEPTAAKSKSEEEVAPKRPRVKLNPTMPGATTATEKVAEEAVEKVAEELKAVPTVQGLGDAPTNAVAVEVPEVAELDDAMEAELNAAMSSAAAAAVVNTPVVGNIDNEIEPDSQVEQEEFGEGSRVKATVQAVAGEDVFFEIPGQRSPGMVSLRQFKDKKPPEVGKVMDVIVSKIDDVENLIHLNLPHGRAKVGGDWSAVTVGQIVDCMVTKTNKGGLEVNISSLRGFLPISQIDTGFVEDLEQYVGQKLTVQVMEVKPKKRNLVVSRRAFLELGRAEEAEKLWETLETGQQYTGTVKTIKDYGAFVNIGSIDGFLHISEISWNRINHPSDVLTVGQQVEVSVVKVDKEKKRIGLGMKQLAANPWSTAEANYSKGTTITGKVTRVAEFGAFVELEPGIEGLVHISELEHQRVNRVSDVLKEGQMVDAQVLEVDLGRKRISLSLKALVEKPVQEKREVADEPAAPKFQRPKNAPPLKGGNSEAKSGGGLFGNPTDFNKK